MQNSDCVSFFCYLDDLIKLESLDPRSFSIFKYCDADTNLLIRRLETLAKKRVYEMVDKQVEFSEDSEVSEESSSKSKRSKSKKKFKSMMERDYGNLHSGLFLNKWLAFADQACSKQPLLKQIEEKKDIRMNFEPNPKHAALVHFLEASSTLVSPGKRGKLDDGVINDFDKTRVLVAAKTQRQAQDIQRLLNAKYLRGKNGERTFFEDKLRYQVNSYREYCQREQVLIKRPNTTKASAITVESAEAFLTQKLSLLLDQKYDLLARRHHAINAKKEEEKVELDPTQHLSYFGSDQYF